MFCVSHSVKTHTPFLSRARNGIPTFSTQLHIIHCWRYMYHISITHSSWSFTTPFAHTASLSLFARATGNARDHHHDVTLHARLPPLPTLSLSHTHTQHNAIVSTHVLLFQHIHTQYECVSLHTTTHTVIYGIGTWYCAKIRSRVLRRLSMNRIQHDEFIPKSSRGI